MNQNDVLPHRPLKGLLVDGFRHAAPDVRIYVLTHFHSDHYSGLDDTFPLGMGAPEDAIIYCTPVTAGLAEHVLGVARKYLAVTPFDSPTMLHLPGGTTAELTFIPANHCPGSAMLLLRSADQAILHTGDCRFCPAMLQAPALQPWVRRGHGHSSLTAAPTASSSSSASAAAAAMRPAVPLDIFLDTTYGHPKHVFLAQEESLRLGVSVVSQFMPRTNGSECIGLGESLESGRLPAHADSSSASSSSEAAGGPAVASAASYDAAAMMFPSALPDESASGAAYDAAAMMFPSAMPDVSSAACASLPGRRDSSAHSSGAAGTAAAAPSSPSPHASVARIAMTAELVPPVPPARTDRTLVIVSTYVIGKERLLLEIARQLHLRIFVSDRKLELVRLLGLSPADAGWFTCSKRDADVHVSGMDACGKHYPYFAPDFARMRRYCAAVNRLHALAELGLLPGSAATTGSAKSGAASSSVGPSVAAGSADAAVVEEDDDDETGAAARRSRRAAKNGTAIGVAGVDISAKACAGGAGASAGTDAMYPAPAAASSAGSAESRRASSSVAAWGWGRFLPQPPEVEARIAALPARYTRVIGLLPTGWVHSNKKKVYTSPPAGVSSAASVVLSSVASSAADSGVADGDDRLGTAASPPAAAVATAAMSSSEAAPRDARAAGADAAVGSEIAAEVHLIPYSEHSSFDELTAFVKALRPRRLVPTVYSDAADRDKIVARFSSLLDTTAAKRDFLKAFGSARSDQRPAVARPADGTVVQRPGAIASSSTPSNSVPAHDPSALLASASVDAASEDAAAGAVSGTGAGSSKKARVESDIIELDDDGDVVQKAPAIDRRAENATTKKAGSSAGGKHVPASITSFFSRK